LFDVVFSFEFTQESIHSFQLSKLLIIRAIFGSATKSGYSLDLIVQGV